MWQSLTMNLALVALVVSCWNHAGAWLEKLSQPLQRVAFALAMGFGAVVSMLFAVRLEPGVIFDLRSSLLAIAGFFGGPEAALVAGGIAAAYRCLVGGAGVPAGLVAIGLSGSAGAAGFLMLRGGKPGLAHVLGLAVGVSAVTVATFWALPEPLRATALQSFGPAVSLLNFTATTLGALAILHMLQLGSERQLLRAALAQAPDLQFIKNRRSEFVAVNRAVAEHNGFRKPAAMRGHTDFHIAPTSRAHKLFTEEQQLLRSGEPLVDQEEKITTVDGETRWFSTSKTALRDSDGSIIGLAGVTRDITRQKQHEAAMAMSRQQLIDALSQVSDGLATFDRQGSLAFHNRQFHEHLPAAADITGLHAAEILSAVGTACRPAGVEAEGLNAWARATAEAILAGGEHEQEFADLRWIRFRSRPLREGGVMMTVADVTRQKDADRMLDAFAASARALSGLDGPAGPVSRRAFDQDLRVALAQAEALKRSLASG